MASEDRSTENLQMTTINADTNDGNQNRGLHSEEISGIYASHNTSGLPFNIYLPSLTIFLTYRKTQTKQGTTSYRCVCVSLCKNLETGGHRPTLCCFLLISLLLSENIGAIGDITPLIWGAVNTR